MVIMASNNIKSIILVLDQSFGTLKLVQENGRPDRLAGVDLNSSTAKALSQFADASIPVTLLGNKDFLMSSLQDLKQFIPSVEEVMSYDHDVQKPLSMLAERTSSTSEQTIFIAADRALRGQADSNGYLAFPHPSIAALAIKGSLLHFVRVRGEEKQFTRIQEVVPYYLERSEHDQMMLLAVMSHAAMTQAIARRLSIEILPLNFSIEDAMFVYLDLTDEQKTPEKLRNQKILFSDGQSMLLAIGPSVANNSVPFHDKHGHFFFLSPDPTLFKPISQPSNFLRTAEMTFDRWPLQKTKITRISTDQSLIGLAPSKSPVDPASFQVYVDRYSGAIDLDSSGAIKSRHCQHPDNSRAIQALLNDLHSMGYSPSTHTFSYQSKILPNVIADLPGTGYFKAEPDLPEQIRQIFLRYPLPVPSEPWIEEITRIVGKEWLQQQRLDKLSPLDLRRELEEIFLKGSPWWLKDSPLPGLEAQLVIVCCHMDSTANMEAVYDRSVDPAPGADDNGSGISATLAIARYLSQFRGKLQNTVRFCFFNAEEEGLYGSNAYASYLKDKGAQIKAVINLDMMGYNNDEQRLFEIHAGHYTPSTRDLCLPIANLIKQWAENLGKLGSAQIYKGTKVGGPEDYDRDVFDGALRRSDHFSFQYHGYPACHISEDFFANLPTEPSKDPNPNYHSFKDKVVDSAFGSDLASVAAFAVKELASH
jgi:hypothetical protein